ncbi:hypothetical protein BFJ63_vAg14917 [Fusarium oxysporum f. sp. narcissi]|uniref:Uncharacterized protein n=1 Tax=Fusarium oxysporum f. sp. narcissi TaxID=451672 RepID=A0A4Q2VAK0_FUSOX|nr:hypothetical protein BFJ63_vAg14917 [Fusarium oxysporum f. sp. narcissi]
MAGRGKASGELPSLELGPKNQYIESRKITPPEHSALPSPPATIDTQRSRNTPILPNILVDFKHKAETCDAEPSTYKLIALDSTAYASAKDEIELAFKQFDYDPEPGCITLRMPSPTHDTFSASLSSAITQKLLRIEHENGRVHDFISQIRSNASSRILLSYSVQQDDGGIIVKQLRRQPDGQFGHKKAALPGLVFEVSYSQDGKKLPSLAKQYIYHTDGNIKAVICIDINYGNDQSTISLWKPTFTLKGDDSDIYTLGFEQAIQEKPFRAADGKPMNPKSTLTLRLHDFAPDSECESVPNIPISISFSDICEFLDDAEEVQKARESKDGRGVKSARKVRKRKLSSSSLEELALDDEEKFKEQEEAVDISASHGDDAFQPRPCDANVSDGNHNLRPRAVKRRA